MLRRKSLLLAVVLIISTLIPAAQIYAHDNCGFISLVNGWARASVEGMTNSAAYGLVVNMTGVEDALIGGSTDAAEAVEIHEMVMAAGDVMQMRPIEGGIVVPNNSFATLQPGGLHIMLINLTQPLIAGEMLSLTLTFREAGDVSISLPIMDAAEMESMGGMDMGGEGGMGGMHGDMATEEAMGDMHMGDMATEEAMGGMDMGGEHADHMHGDMEIPEDCHHVFFLNAWVRPAGAGQPNSAAYGLMLNLTDEDVSLVGGSADFVEAVEIHEMVMGAGDVMQMRPIEGGLVIPAGGAVVLQRGGYHVMLIGLTSELAADSMVDLTLTLSDGHELVLTLPVQEPPMEGDMGG